MDLEELPEILPHFFFEPVVPIYPRKGSKFSSDHLLPFFSDFHLEEKFADVYIAYDLEGLYLQFDVDVPFNASDYPDFLRKDAIELFIHTKEAAIGRYMNKFSHHFLIFPKKVNGIAGMEITKFRNEDQHPLALPEMITVEADLEKKSYQVQVKLSRDILYGFDPENSKEMRFDYRIHRFQDTPQYFFMAKEDITEHHLQLWPKLIMT